MSKPAPLPASSPRILDRLIEAARHDPGAVALRHKRRGVWWTWSWRDVVTVPERRP